jgi:hypothetical protein
MELVKNHAQGQFVAQPFGRSLASLAPSSPSHGSLLTQNKFRMIFPQKINRAGHFQANFVYKFVINRAGHFQADFV